MTKPKSPRSKKYVRPRLFGGKPPKATVILEFNEAQIEAVWEYFERVGVHVRERKRVISLIEKAVNDHRIAEQRVLSGAKLSLPKKEQREAASISFHALRLSKALSKAGPETMKRIVQSLLPTPVAGERAIVKDELKSRYSRGLIRLHEAAEYAESRARRHMRRGDKADFVKFLVVDLASIWCLETGQPFSQTLKSARRFRDSARMSSDYVWHVLFRVAGFRKREFSDARLEDIITYAHDVVADAPYRPTAASSESTDDREYDS